MRSAKKSSAAPTHVAVIGAGNWGTSLLAALRKAGIPAGEVIQASSRKIGRRRSNSAASKPVALEEARLDAEIFWLCVPDAAIAPVALRLARRLSALASDRRPLVVHSSGALSSTVLSAAADAGARTASAHPMMSFPNRVPVPLDGVSFAVETQDVRARAALFALIRRLGGRPFPLHAEGKALYHAAGTLASPLLTTLLGAAMECMEAAGLSRTQAMRLLAPLSARTVGNVFANGPERGLSGPMVRGDAATVALHLRALAPHPLVAGVYRSLAAESLAILPSANAESIRALLREQTGGAGQAADRPGPGKKSATRARRPLQDGRQPRG
jgi:predicted short-subunit dehydrogenase-like oxidoreductase (DUF2520 family)